MNIALYQDKDCVPRKLVAESGPIQFEGKSLIGALISSPAAGVPELRPHEVFLRTKSTTMTFRDIAMLRQFLSLGRISRAQFFGCGSDFCGEVVAIGASVDNLVPGDIVMGRLGMPDPEKGFSAGELLSTTLRGYQANQVQDGGRLIRVPAGVDCNRVTAAGSAAQLAAAVVRRARPTRDEKILITGAGSCLGWYLAHMLRDLGCRLFLATTSSEHFDRLTALAIGTVVRVDPAWLLVDHHLIREAVEDRYFDMVIDPFCDLYGGKALALTRRYGKYVACGYAGTRAPMTDLSVAVEREIEMIGVAGVELSDARDALSYCTTTPACGVPYVVHNRESVLEYIGGSINWRQRHGRIVYEFE